MEIMFQLEFKTLSKEVCHLYRYFSPSRYGADRYSGSIPMMVKDLRHTAKVPHSMVVKEDLKMVKEVMEAEQERGLVILILEST